ncbi:hypothetical protein [Maridesulfovibrio frigidus]|uniref:hypothetical protein n=1 Tax=Maridesulfovibrio frigidus TaxID=340956 RepID=UPI0004E1BEA2|nr:hypothetical protein [Maridesulfovibrio frigidus]
MVKKVLFGIMVASCVLVASLEEVSADPNCLAFGPEVSLEELESSLIKGIESKGCLYVTKLHRILEIYYDTPNLFLLNDNRFVRFQAREKLGRVKSISINQQERLVRKKRKYIMEAQMMDKGGVITSSPLHQYRSASSQIGKHPLLGMIARNMQVEAVSFLKENGIDTPLALKGMMHVSNTSLYIGIYGEDDKVLKGIMNFVSFYDTKTGDHILTRVLFDDGNEVINSLAENLAVEYGAESGLNEQGEVMSDYTLLYRQMSKMDWFFDYRMRYPSVFNLGRASLFFLCGLGIIGVLFGKRFFRNKDAV